MVDLCKRLFDIIAEEKIFEVKARTYGQNIYEYLWCDIICKWYNADDIEFTSNSYKVPLNSL